jgi:hypothetical protein
VFSGSNLVAVVTSKRDAKKLGAARYAGNISLLCSVEEKPTKLGEFRLRLQKDIKKLHLNSF